MENRQGDHRQSVLVLEDSGLIALEIATALEDAGLEAVVCESVAEARRMLRQQRFFAALLDFRLGDGTCGPVALTCRHHGYPVAIVSGVLSGSLDPVLLPLPRFRKPVAAEDLVNWVLANGRDPD